MSEPVTGVVRRRNVKPKLNKKGLLLSAATGAAASLAISIEQGKLGKTEALRAGVGALIASLAFLQHPTFPPPRE